MELAKNICATLVGLHMQILYFLIIYIWKVLNENQCS